MLKEAVYHQMDSSYAFLVDIHTLVIRLRTGKDDLLSCTLHYGDRCDMQKEPSIYTKNMEVIASDDLFDYYEVRIQPTFNRVFYYFNLKSKTEQYYYFSHHFHTTDHVNRTLFYQYAYFREKDIAKTPGWVQGSVMYQIFPDSFANGKNHLDLRKATYTSPSGCRSQSHKGGTLKGITNSLDYLSALGTNCIYLTPIFHSNSYHKYDIIDYYAIDPLLGTEEEFKELVDACHSKGIKVILDGVFNHTSPDFFAFKDIMQNGASSRYKDWYLIHDYPVKVAHPPNYEAFAYVENMPRTNTYNLEVQEYFCQVGAYWLKEFHIDGWRLDVANEIDHDFWRAFRNTVKDINPDALILGEIWEDANSFLEGDQFDSVMNYPFMYLCEELFAKEHMSLKEFTDRLGKLRMRYKEPVQNILMNFLDCHDVPRFLSKCKGELWKYRLAMIFLMTYPGVPSVFYGDERNIQGFEEKYYRDTMPWQDDYKEEYYLIQQLIDMRIKHICLQNGHFNTVLVDDAKGVLVYSRTCAKDKIIVAMNLSKVAESISLQLSSEVFKECLYGVVDLHCQQNVQTFTLQPQQATILKYIAQDTKK